MPTETFEERRARCRIEESARIYAKLRSMDPPEGPRGLSRKPVYFGTLDSDGRMAQSGPHAKGQRGRPWSEQVKP